jgi:hypothetical protein
MDINACIHHLELNANRYRLTQSPSPHEFVSWDEDNSDPQPTQAELEAAWAEIADDIAWKPVRDNRDSLLINSDWTAVTDSALSSGDQIDWEYYRQELRDLPQVYDDVDDVVWPDKPEE